MPPVRRSSSASRVPNAPPIPTNRPSTRVTHYLRVARNIGAPLPREDEIDLMRRATAIVAEHNSINEPRIVQPGRGRRAEFGIITSGRVIPTLNAEERAQPNLSEAIASAVSNLPLSEDGPIRRQIEERINELNEQVSRNEGGNNAAAIQEQRILASLAEFTDQLMNSRPLDDTGAFDQYFAQRTEVMRERLRARTAHLAARFPERPQQRPPPSRAPEPTIVELPIKTTPAMIKNDIASKRLLSESSRLQKFPPIGYTLIPTGDNILEWSGVIEGPKGSYYEGGVFFLNIDLRDNYPFACPNVTFRTRIYHSQVDPTGVYDCKELRHDWKATMTLRDVMDFVIHTMKHPRVRRQRKAYTAAQKRKISYDFRRKAMLWTKRYA